MSEFVMIDWRRLEVKDLINLLMESEERIQSAIRDRDEVKAALDEALRPILKDYFKYVKQQEFPVWERVYTAFRGQDIIIAYRYSSNPSACQECPGNEEVIGIMPQSVMWDKSWMKPYKDAFNAKEKRKKDAALEKERAQYEKLRSKFESVG